MAVYQKLPLSTVLKYYKRLEVQQALVESGVNKEVAVSFGGTGYGKRPDVLVYPSDILNFVRGGATSFHCSEELWRNPLQITTGMRPEEYHELRLGWDLILDIDCPELEFSKIAADLLVQALKHNGVTCVSVKFSGNHGFHIGVPAAAFPEVVNGIPVKNLFPEGPRRIAAYLASMIRDVLAQRLLLAAPVHVIAEKIKKPQSEIVKAGKLDAFGVLSIDTVLIAPRHLYRMPYSLNEKSGLVSVVISPGDILSFDKMSALPEKVVPRLKFLDPAIAVAGEARKLIVQAFDFKTPLFVEVPKEKKEFEPLLDAVPETFFPPCIQKISQGMQDGKKRALLVLVNFLSSCGWSFERIESYIQEWNKRNLDPLREVYIQGQLRYAKARKKAVLPPSCINKAYMADMGVCLPDGFCQKIKNPAHYAVAKQRMVARMAEQEKPKRASKEERERDAPIANSVEVIVEKNDKNAGQRSKEIKHAMPNSKDVPVEQATDRV
ncbi:hypothetical protein HY489_00145 [Candidatus Woesearchaeota archaeon]|nr:hypothetical protein [Candidatus Woesearchaeota archaeon]